LVIIKILKKEYLVILMDKSSLEYALIRGLEIPYMGVKVKQPTINDIDEIGLLRFSSYKSTFIILKEHLQLTDELIVITKDKSFFETLFIIDGYSNNVDSNTILYTDMLIMSLIFFLGIDINKNMIEKNMENKCISIANTEGQNIFILNNDNFEEFSELIRLVCNCDKLEIDKDTNTNVVQYADADVQKIYEDLIKQHKKDEEEKKKANDITLSDVIGSICINENTKYNYKNIEELTIWQLFYQFTAMFTKENIDIVKSQYVSGNYTFDKVPDLDWLKKVKVKLPKDNKLIK